MKKIVALSGVIAVLLSWVGAALAAGTITLTKNDPVPGQDVTVYTYTMTADASAATFPATDSLNIDGWIIGVETDPDGTAAPTDLYDIVLSDVNGLDVLDGNLANRSTSATQRVMSPQPYVRGPVTITVTNNSVNSAIIVMKVTVLR